MHKFLYYAIAALACMVGFPQGLAAAESPRGQLLPPLQESYISPKPANGFLKFTPRPAIGMFDISNYAAPTAVIPSATGMKPQSMKAPGDINLLGWVPSTVGNYMGYICGIPYREGQTFSQVSTMQVNSGWGATYSNGSYYCVFQMAFGTTAYNYMYKYDASTWMMQSYKMLSDMTLLASATAADPMTGEIYGCFINADATGYQFGVANYDEGTRTTICDIAPGKPWACCVFDSDGTLYAIDATGMMFTVDKSNGALTPVGDTGVTTQYLAGACYDPARGRILRAVCNVNTGTAVSGLYEVNPSTAESTLLMPFPNNEEVMGLFIGAPLANDMAPETPADIEASFPEGMMSGNVSFTIPETFFGGEPATGEINWSVYGFYQTLASGTANPGDRVEVPVTAPYAGNATFTVTLSNAAGDSPKGSVSCFVGKGTPTIPVPYITCDNGLVTLTWDPVTKSVDGGYINPDEITYTVTRWPDNVIVASDIKETTFSEQLEIPSQPTLYYYQVVAKYDDKVSGLGQSLEISLGNFTVPYLGDFTNFNTIRFCTVVNANDDNVTWVGGGLGASLISYTGNFDTDDWLFTPDIKFEKDHAYYVEFTFHSYPNTIGNFEQASIEIKRGSKPGIEGMTVTMQESTPLDEIARKPLGFVFRPDTQGSQYLGVHAQGTNNNWIVLEKIEIKDAGMPDSVQNFEVITKPYPSLTGTVKFDAPTKTVGGDPLTAIDRIELKRAGVIVKTFENPTPGESLTFDDTVGENVYASGNYQWTVSAFNSIGEGLKAERIVYIGLDAPAAPENFKAVEKDNSGTLLLSWDPVTTDVHGTPLAPEYINYMILNGPYYVDDAPEIIDNSSYTFEACSPSEQTFVMPGIRLYNDRSSSVVYSDLRPVGKPYAEYFESATGGDMTHNMASYDVNYAQWTVGQDVEGSGYASADADGGFIGMSGEEPGSSASLSLGKFNLKDMQSPQFSFMLMNIWDGEHPNNNYLEVIVNDGEENKVLANFSCDLHDAGCDIGRYVKRSVDLTPYVDKGNITISLRGTLVDYQVIAIDRLKVAPVLDHNLSALALRVPASITPGEEATFTVSVENCGRNVAKDYSVTLMRDGKEIATVSAEADLPVHGIVNIPMTDIVSALSPATVNYSARINYAADLDVSDNTTATAPVTVTLPPYPVPESLEGSVNEAGQVTLTWSAPDLNVSTEAVTEGFENSDSWAIDNYGDWTFIDGDGENTYVWSDQQYPGAGGPSAFVVYPLVSSTYFYIDPYAGNQFLAASSPDNGASCDDWAISPLLDGSAQTVTFYARSFFIKDGGESFRFLYSTSGVEREDFIEIERVDGVPAEWTLYTFTLPAGATHFAINCVSEAQYLFMIDDVTFTPRSPNADLTLTGYNIYRDEVKVNSDIVETASFNETPEEDGTYNYVVTAVYNKGESAASAPVSILVTRSGISQITSEGITVCGGKGIITVAGAKVGTNVRVINPAGMTVISRQSTGRDTYPVVPGCYIVTIGATSYKVHVY